MKIVWYSLISVLAVAALAGVLVWHGAAGGAAALRLQGVLADAFPGYFAQTPGNDALPVSEDELRARVRTLEEMLARKNSEIAALERALREFEGFRREMPAIRCRAVRVSSRTDDEAVIDGGAADGLREGWGVAQGMTLAGIIGLLEKEYSRVLLTSHPGCLVPARAEKSRDICTVRGQGGNNAVAVFYANRTETAPGEKIFTSGMLGRLPSGLLVGTIADFPQPAAGGMMEAPVRLAADLPALEQVLVVAPLAEPQKAPETAPAKK